MCTQIGLRFGTNSAAEDYLFKKRTKINFNITKPTKNISEYIPQETTEIRQQKYWVEQYIFMLIKGPSYYPDGEWHNTSTKSSEHMYRLF